MSDKNSLKESGTTPLQQTQLFGHIETLHNWQQAFNAQKLHHGLLITGPNGVGKATLVFHFLKWLFKQNQANPHIIERQILAGSHPGLKIIERLFDEKRQRYAGEITLDAVAPIFDFLRLSVMDGGYRAIIIDGADTMNRNAQNTILKLLEEPPAKTFFFLLVEQPGTILPTIRSRCMRYTLLPLSQNEFANGLANLQPAIPIHDHASLYALSGGSLGQAIALFNQAWADLYSDTIQAALALLNPDTSAKTAMKWAETYAPSTQEAAYDLLQDLMTKRLAQVVALLQQNAPLMPLSDNETALIKHWHQQDTNTLLQAYDRLTMLFRMGDRSHLDRKLVLLQALNAFIGSPNAVATRSAFR